MKNKIKKISITALVMIIGFAMGIAMPIVINAEGNDANVGQVLKGKTFTSSLVGIAKEGAIEDFSKSIITKSVNATNDNFIETIPLTPGYYDQIQVDTEAVYNAGVAAGTISGNISNCDVYTRITSPDGSAQTITTTKDYKLVVLCNVDVSGAGSTSSSTSINGGTLINSRSPQSYHGGGCYVTVNQKSYVNVPTGTTITLTTYYNQATAYCYY